MKTRTSSIWISGLVLLMAWSPNGLAQDEIDRSNPFPWDAMSLSTSAPLVTNSIPPATNVPPKIRLSPWTTEVVKLAQVGIDDNVMLSFIDNSGMFNLGAEQIIYLADLGIPSEIISEMLRHDAEVISGVRRLTISSDPPRDASIQITFTAGSSASVKTNAQSAITSALPAVVSGQPAIAPSPQPLAEATPDTGNTSLSVMEFAMREPARTDVVGQQRQSEAKKGLYRIREPFPVPLTAPILLVRAAERTPNTIVIEWFPESTDER